MKLVEYFDKHKCDKGNIKHRYDRAYEPVFEQYRDEPINILEIGIYKGASMKAHLEYFPNATLYGIDIFDRLRPTDVSVLKQERVKWVKGDSTRVLTKEIKEFLGDVKFDIIVDDGNHMYHSQTSTFRNFFPYLSDRGTYFIEDVFPYDIMTYQETQHQWLVRHAMQMNAMSYDELKKEVTKHNVKYHDFRKTNDPDSFIIEVTR